MITLKATEVAGILAGWVSARELIANGRALTLFDPAVGPFNAAGDFDWLLPVSGIAFPVLSRVDPYGVVTVTSRHLAALAVKWALLLKQARQGPERNGLLRLQALALAGRDKPGTVIRFTWD